MATADTMGGADLRLVSWGDGSAVPTSGINQALVGTDHTGRLHIRIFDVSGNRVTDTDETRLPQTQAEAVSALKPQLPGLLPPHALTAEEKARVIAETTTVGFASPSGPGRFTAHSENQTVTGVHSSW